MQDETAGKHEKQQQAVIIGASIAGLLAARVLTQYYEQVLIIERDALPAEPRPRAGVPQSHHLHRLLPRGKMILERLFPGFLDSLLEQGAFPMEHTNSLLIAKDGRTTLSAPSMMGKEATCSRAMLEWEIRRRVQAQAGVRFLARKDVIGLIPSADRKHITGIQLREHGQLAEQTSVRADLIIDASGRSSKLTHWLQELGYHLPEDEQVHSAIGYSTRYYKFATGTYPEWSALFKFFAQSDGVAYQRIEDDTCAVIIGNIGGHYPPTDATAFEQRLADSLGSYLPKLLQGAQPLGDPRGYRIPMCVRHHFEQMEDWPGGLLVMGDAFCNFDPIYGQGMSVAAIEAETLERCLYEQQGHIQPGFERYVLQRMQETIAPAWWLSSISDLNSPGVTYTGPSPIRSVRLIQLYLDLYLKNGMLHDRELYQKGLAEQAYLPRYLMMNGLLISPREVINARMLANLLAFAEASDEQKLLTAFCQDYPGSIEQVFDEAIPDFSLSFEGLPDFAPTEEVPVYQ
ncbi:FAD-dependent monooxygenase [Ktedonosporobacter rubrisoli]|uniref:FAD-dependent monooxygenase n=1 Tax=Ktedonosporobacter rubrisoli TaxID=2509675 RepID=A0A4P6JLQ7_KTERU|nr:FAD-dependent monooxygenase [Ktedonosporobacter rubrisoli]QBD75960.1 FAD-dependent monooxygenase [Ktedonosporobacter rubrisoli]